MTDEAKRAEKKLAALMLVELDVSVEPDALRRFIKAKWATIAPLAHIVHSAPDYSKASPGGGASGGQLGGGSQC